MDSRFSILNPEPRIINHQTNQRTNQPTVTIMKPFSLPAGVKDPYVKRVLSQLVGKDPMKVYAQTPEKLNRLLADVRSVEAQAHPISGKWSIAQIVSHLADCEIVLSYRLRKIIAEPGSEIELFDEKKWAKRLRYDSADWREKLELYSVLRKRQVALLRSLSPKEWKQIGIHAERGKETVARMVQLYAGHDLNHLGQIEAIRTHIRRKSK